MSGQQGQQNSARRQRASRVHAALSRLRCCAAAADYLESAQGLRSARLAEHEVELRLGARLPVSDALYLATLDAGPRQDPQQTLREARLDARRRASRSLSPAAKAPPFARRNPFARRLELKQAAAPGSGGSGGAGGSKRRRGGGAARFASVGRLVRRAAARDGGGSSGPGSQDDSTGGGAKQQQRTAMPGWRVHPPGGMLDVPPRLRRKRCPWTLATAVPYAVQGLAPTVAGARVLDLNPFGRLGGAGAQLWGVSDVSQADTCTGEG